MSFRLFNQIIVVGLLLAVSGCVPQQERATTETKSASDVKITTDQPKVAPSIERAPAEKSKIVAAETPPQAMNPAPKGMETVAEDTTTPAPSTPVAEPKSAVAAYAGAAKFMGRVSIKGAVSELAPILAKGADTKDMVCSEQAVPNQTVVASKAGGLANVFVYMKKSPSSGVPAPSEEAVVIDQVGCVFFPHARIIRVGQKTTLKNSDPVAHNVNVKAFQEGYNSVVPALSSTEHTFRFAERLPASTVCDFHTFMSAWVLPLDHPWGAVTDADGRFEIKDLPVGDWEFILWHEKVGYVERSVKVKAAQNSAIEMNFEVPASSLSQ